MPDWILKLYRATICGKSYGDIRCVDHDNMYIIMLESQSGGIPYVSIFIDKCSGVGHMRSSAEILRELASQEFCKSLENMLDE